MVLGEISPPFTSPYLKGRNHESSFSHRERKRGRSERDKQTDTVSDRENKCERQREGKRE